MTQLDILRSIEVLERVVINRQLSAKTRKAAEEKLQDYISRLK